MHVWYVLLWFITPQNQYLENITIKLLAIVICMGTGAANVILMWRQIVSGLVGVFFYDNMMITVQPEEKNKASSVLDTIIQLRDSI